MDSEIFLLPVRKRLAFLLAKAACEVFPDAQVVAAVGTEQVFFADLCFSQAFDKAYLPLIEDKFSALIKAAAAIETREMVPASARGLFQKNRQDLQVKQLPKDARHVIEVSLLEDFALLVSGIDEGEMPRFFWELLGFFEGGEVEGLPIIRIAGIACGDLASLKTCKKSWAQRPYIPASELAKKNHYLLEIEDNWIWLPRGEKIRRKLHSIWEELMVKENFSFVSTGGNFLFESCLGEIASSQKEGSLKFAEAAIGFHEEEWHREGIFSPICGWTDRWTQICPKERVREICISSLQFILQIPRMLSFNARVVLSSARSGEIKDLRAAADAVGVEYHVEIRPDGQNRIDVQVDDRLGRWWTISSLWIAKEMPMPGRRAVIATCFGKWERLMGLLLEKCESGQEVSLDQFMNRNELEN